MTTKKREFKELEIDMFLAMRSLLGSGYVPEYYEQAAAEFIQIAERCINEALKEEI